MVVKLVLELSYFLAEECYKNDIIESKVSNGKYSFSTAEHTFHFDKSEDAFHTDGYDFIEVDFTGALLWESSKDDINRLWSKLDKTKQFFAFWHYGEGMSNQNDNWKTLLDLGIKVYTSTWSPELHTHPNLIYDLAFSFHYFNFYNGSCYTDRTDRSRMIYPKKYKVGLYGLSKWKQTSQTIRNWRNEYISYFESKSDTKPISYSKPSLFELSQFMRNQHFSMPFDFKDCNYFITAESHFNQKNVFPYFTSEKVLKGAWLEVFDINMMVITSPMHMKDLHDAGFWFANSKYITEYTPECILESLYKCYESDEIIQTNNLEVVDRILSENIFEKHNILCNNSNLKL